MRKEADGLWYLDPESLRDCKAMTTEEIREFRTIRLESRRDYYFPSADADVTYYSDPMSVVKSNHPSLADSLVPLGLTCDSNDIRLEIVSAAVKGKEALIVFSLKDLAEDRLNRSLWDFWTSVTLHRFFSGSSLYDLGQNPTEKTLNYALHVSDGKLFDPDHSFLDFRLPDELQVSHNTYTDLIPLLREYGSQSGALVDPPEDLEGIPYPPDYIRTTKEYFLEQNGKVLDSSHPLDIPLSEHVFLSGIGLKEDGMIHVQLYSKNNQPVMELMEYPIGSITGLQITSSVDSPAFSPVSWSGGESEFNGWAEYLFPWDPDQGEITTLTAVIGEIGDPVPGTWEIRIPLEKIQVIEE